jgi:hypothetical protein
VHGAQRWVGRGRPGYPDIHEMHLFGRKAIRFDGTLGVPHVPVHRLSRGMDAEHGSGIGVHRLSEGLGKKAHKGRS